jgi:hypothetical protein
MKHLALIISLTTFVLVGCHKKEAAPPETAAAPASQQPAKPLPPPPAYVAANAQNAPAENVTGEVNAFLTQQLRIFIREKGRMPESFAELVRVRLDSMPRPPAGKKWAIDNASKEVKAVASQ